MGFSLKMSVKLTAPPSRLMGHDLESIERRTLKSSLKASWKLRAIDTEVADAIAADEGTAALGSVRSSTLSRPARCILASPVH